MFGAFSQGRIGGIRNIGAYITEINFGNDVHPNYIKWLEKGTKKDSDEAEQAYDEWYERTYINGNVDGNYDEANEVHDIICRLVSTSEQATLEKGMKVGAQLILELLDIV